MDSCKSHSPKFGEAGDDDELLSRSGSNFELHFISKIRVQMIIRRERCKTPVLYHSVRRAAGQNLNNLDCRLKEI